MKTTILKKTCAITLVLALIFSVGFSGFGSAVVSAAEVVDPEVIADVKPPLIPKPVSYELLAETGVFKLTPAARIHFAANEEVAGVAEFLAGKLKPSTGFALPVTTEAVALTDNVIDFLIVAKDASIAADATYEILGDEGYVLETVNGNFLKIAAYSPNGLFNGAQTLRQLFPAKIEISTVVNDTNWEFPLIRIMDYPRYEYRGIMLDVSRHFFPKEAIMRQLDLLAQFKINSMHLHLSDDQGFRIAFDAYPDLASFAGTTQISFQSTYNTSNVVGTSARLFPGSLYYSHAPGYYSKADYKEIVDYAQERFIQIVPEIEFPSHCYGQLLSLPSLNANGELIDAAVAANGNQAFYTGTVGRSTTLNPATDEYTRTYIKTIMKELAEMTPSKYIHLGGDEANQMTTAQYNEVTSLVLDEIRENGKLSIQWNQAHSKTDDFAVADVLQNWGDGQAPWDYATRALESGSKILASLSARAYIDHFTSNQMAFGLSWARSSGIQVATAYQWDPEDAVIEKYKNQGYVIGLETPLWSESIGSPQVQDMLIYPRMLGYAEIGWSPYEVRYDGMTSGSNYQTGTPKSTPALEDYLKRLAPFGERMTYQGILFMNETSVWPSQTVERPVNFSVSTPINTPVGGKLEFSATTKEGGNVDVRIASTPTQGSVTVAADGTWAFTPATNFVGKDSFVVAYMVDGYGIPLGPSTSRNRGTAQYNGYTHVTVTVTPEEDVVYPVNISLLAANENNIRIELDRPVPGLLAANFSISDTTIRYAESFDNGSTYLLITRPRANDTEYILTAEKEGYSFNPAVITPRAQLNAVKALVAKRAATIVAKLTGSARTDLKATLFGKTAAIKNGSATFKFNPGEIMEIGQYELFAIDPSGVFVTQTALDVVNEPANLWTPELALGEDNFTVTFSANVDFNELTKSVKINDAAIDSALAAANGNTIIVDNVLAAGQTVAISGIQYPALYPSYSFTFTMTAPAAIAE